MVKTVLVGVLALQGAFVEHIQIMRALGADCREVRQASDWTTDLDGLIIPGGESTVISKLLCELGLLAGIRQSILTGRPVFGTCAGLILLAKEVIGQEMTTLSCMDISVVRNAYGRQLGSFYTRGRFAGHENIPMTFIRAPYIEAVGDEVEILSIIDGHIVAARQNNMLVTAFHPELSDHTLIHAYYLSMIEHQRIAENPRLPIRSPGPNLAGSGNRMK